MEKHLPELTGKGIYLPPTTETMVLLCIANDICTSDPAGPRSSYTEEWEEEDLSMY